MTLSNPSDASAVGAPLQADRWVRVGSSTATDTDQAVDEVLRALDGLPQPKLALLFASKAHDLGHAAGRIADRVGEDRLIGCTTAGEHSTGAATRGGMTLWALGGEGVSVAVRMGQGGPSGLRVAAREAAGCLHQVDGLGHTVLLLLADGLCGDQVEVVRGAYEVAGVDVPLVGGCAGDDMAMQETHQIFGRQVLGQAVVAAAISSVAPIGIGVSHCWEPHSAPMLVTGSSGTVVRTLEDRPALDVYFEAFDAPEEVRRDLVAFSAWATTRPLGIRRRDRIEIRFVTGADFEQRTLITIAEVPQGGVAHLMCGDARSVLDATQQACRMAAEGLGGAEMQGLLLFDCVARRSVLQEEWLHREIACIDAARNGMPVGGFYTYGEIARTQGAGGFHNQTLVALAVA